MTYPGLRTDPVFPALRLQTYRIDGTNRSQPHLYYNNKTDYSKIVCEESTEICDYQTNECWNGPPGHARPRNVVVSRSVASGRNGSHEDPARMLLEIALSGSSIINSISGAYTNFEATSHCQYFRCEALPADQWIVECRRWFEVSLALAQFYALEIVRGIDNDGADYQNIPPTDRGLCHVFKFRSTGWRNVNVWGFFGILVVSLGLFIGSIKTDAGTLWLTLGAKVLGRWVRASLLVTLRAGTSLIAFTAKLKRIFQRF